MAIPEKDIPLENIRVEKLTPGGDTYHITIPGQKEKPLCWRKSKQSEDGEILRCANKAGYKTDHIGYGACKYHGGCAGKPARITGKATRIERYMLQKKVDEYLEMDRSQLLDLTYELAVSKALFNEFIEKAPDNDGSAEYGMFLTRFSNIIKTLSDLVDKISKIENRNAITTAQVLYLKAAIAEILIKYLPEQDYRENAMRELQLKLGGEQVVDIAPREIPRIINM